MTAESPARIAALTTRLAREGVKYALASFLDIHGVSKTKVVPLSHLDQVMRGSELFTGAAPDGVPQQVGDEEVAAHPDPDSCTILPWKPELAWFASTLRTQGRPFDARSHGILQRQLAVCADMGHRFHLGVETEFFVLKEGPGDRPVPVGERDTLDKPRYDLRGFLDHYGYLDERVEAMNKLGWDVYSFDHEDANGKFETDFMYADALTMADRCTFFRMMAGELAHRRGWFASFMPKPFPNRTGSGAHYSMSLATTDGRRNLFEDPNDPRGCGLSKLGYRLIAGILRHAPAICAVIAPTVNSCKRLVKQGSMSGFTWAPVFACCGNDNRTNMLRIPPGGGRVDCRAADISSNLYPGAAMCLPAGLEGIRENLDPGEPDVENRYLKTDAELRERGITWLPRTLDEAVDAFSGQPAVPRRDGRHDVPRLRGLQAPRVDRQPHRSLGVGTEALHEAVVTTRGRRPAGRNGGRQ